MKTSALQTLGRRYGLTSAQVGQLDAVLDQLERQQHAPTSVRDAERALDVHIADSLVALELAVVGAAARIGDVGAGAGFPGVALAIALPNVEVCLVESQRRRCAFLEALCVHAAVDNARVVCARAEEWREGIGTRDLVVVRALAPQPVVLEYAAPLLVLGGALVDWRSRRDRGQEHASAAAARQLGLRCVEIRRVNPFEGAKERHLHVYLKVRDTPPRYPRRAGIARKRPLAG